MTTTLRVSPATAVTPVHAVWGTAAGLVYGAVWWTVGALWITLADMVCRSPTGTPRDVPASAAIWCSARSEARFGAAGDLPELLGVQMIPSRKLRRVFDTATCEDRMTAVRPRIPPLIIERASGASPRRPLLALTSKKHSLAGGRRGAPPAGLEPAAKRLRRHVLYPLSYGGWPA